MPEGPGGRTYVIKKRVLGPVPELEIDQSRFSQLLKAREGVSQTLAMEEKYNLNLENYLEFERHLLSSTVDQVMRQTTDWSDYVGRVHDANRYLLNLLSSGRLLIDQLKHHMSTIFGSDSAEYLAFVQTIRNEHSEKLGFRVVEALRNYVQHRGLPIATLGHPHWRDEMGKGERFLRSTVTPSLSVRELASDPKFKKGVLEELKALSEDNVDLKPFVREWMESLRNIVEAARFAVRDSIGRWDAALLAAEAEYMAVHGEDVLGLAAIERDARRAALRTVYTNARPAERRAYLRQRNSRFRSLGEIQITSASEKSTEDST